MAKQQWRKAGVVGVDAGVVMITDPCYVLADAGRKDALAYDRAVSLDQETDSPNGINGRHKRMVAGDLTALELPDTYGGFLIPSGYGDGSYPLYVLVSDEGDWGTRIMGVFIDFDGGIDPNDLPFTDH